MKFQRENAHDIIEEIKPLLLEHYKEIAHYLDIPFKPDYDMYKRLEDSGFLRVFTARLDDGKLVGYAVFVVKTNLHYSTSLQAQQDILFISSEYRGRGGILIKWCDAELAKEGVQVVYHHIKQKHNFGAMMERMGYELVDLIYAKRLDTKGE